jgi:hypothetical protein
VGLLSRQFRLKLASITQVLLPRLPVGSRFGLLPVRSPLLGKSLDCFLLLGVLRCFSSPRMPSSKGVSANWRMGCPIRKSTDHCSYAAPRSLSQLYTSFFASVCLGIHRVPLVCFYYMACTASPPHGLHKYFMLLVYNCGLDVGRTASRYLGVARTPNRTRALLSSITYLPKQVSNIRPFTIAIAFIMSKNPHSRVWNVSACSRAFRQRLKLKHSVKEQV